MLRNINKNDLRRVSLKYVKCGGCGLRFGDYCSESLFLEVLKNQGWLYNSYYVELYCPKCSNEYIIKEEEK